jgi:hypothetical protein
LRWIYVQDHAARFLALAAVTALALAGVIFFLSDPARGFAIGAIPVAFGGIGWLITNRAGYPDRHPNSLPHERLEGVEASGEPGQPGWDPFSGERTLAPADPFELPQQPRRDAAPTQETASRPSDTEPGNATDPQKTRVKRRPWDDEPAGAGAATAVAKRTSPAGPEPARGEARASQSPATPRQTRAELAPAEAARRSATGRESRPRNEAGDSAAGAAVGPPQEPLTPAEAAVQAAKAAKSKRRRQG